MFWTEMLLALFTAIVIAAVSIPFLAWRGGLGEISWLTPLCIFFMLFVFSWAGGIWLGHMGPALFGVYWLPFLIGAMLYVMVHGSIVGLGTISPHRNTHEEFVAEGEREDVARGAASVFFGFLTVLFLVCIVTHYVA